MSTGSKRIESEQDVQAYIAKLHYAIKNGAKINFQMDRKVDAERDLRYTNRYTVATLFPDENPVDVLKRELLTLSVEEYICTVSDIRFPKRSEMRVFGKTYRGSDDVYIKIRVELIDQSCCGNPTTFVMSFHFAESPFYDKDFPYRK